MYDTLLYHYQNNVLLLGRMLEGLRGIYETGRCFILFSGRSLSHNNSCFTSRCASLSSWWGDDGNNAQRGSSDEALIWGDGKGFRQLTATVSAALTADRTVYKTPPPSDGSRLDISTQGKRSVALTHEESDRHQRSVAFRLSCPSTKG